MNLRIKYGKTSQGKFISHLDLVRAWERAFRRAQVPIAYSQGFNPHPKMSFGSALSVGVSSSGEYMDVVLQKSYPIQELKRKLENYLPAGLVIYDIVEIDSKVPSLMTVINRAKYLIKANLIEPINQTEFENIIKNLLKQEKIPILRHTKKGLKEKDIRPGIFEIHGKITGEQEIQIELTVQTGSEGNVRPEEVLEVIKKNGIPLDLEIIDIHREGLYVGGDTGLVSPLSVTI